MPKHTADLPTVKKSFKGMRRWGKGFERAKIGYHCESAMVPHLRAISLTTPEHGIMDWKCR
ncbi:hypothetical protein NIM86_01790 [Notoacmeibacter sp. MSK16QG-6]|nr:hypothetical protein [Notoacmeibacter sp. MSK16QG-6]